MLLHATTTTATATTAAVTAAVTATTIAAATTTAATTSTATTATTAAVAAATTSDKALLTSLDYLTCYHYSVLVKYNFTEKTFQQVPLQIRKDFSVLNSSSWSCAHMQHRNSREIILIFLLIRLGRLWMAGYRR